MLLRCDKVPMVTEGFETVGCVADVYPELRLQGGAWMLEGEDAATQFWRTEGPVDVAGIDGIVIIED